MKVSESDIQTSGFVSLLKKSLHGGLISTSSLDSSEEKICKNRRWIQRAVKFTCTECGEIHTTAHSKVRCVRRELPVDPKEVEEGYRLEPGLELEIETETDYTILVKEHSDIVNASDLSYKSIVFVPDIEQLEFTDRAGSVVFVPLERIPSIFETDSSASLIQDIREKRRQLLEWGNLEPNGDDKFEEIIFSLVNRTPSYSNAHWGGSGPDQGKDAFCSVDQGARETSVLVQAKFNNEGDAVNANTAEKYCRKAGRHDCRGLILSAVRTSGDLESEFYDGEFHTRGVRYFELWSGPEIKEMLAEHPDLIAEYFFG